MKILGKFKKDKTYTIVDMDGALFALHNLKEDGSYDHKYECKEFAPGLYGIGPEIKKYTVSIAIDGRIDVEVETNSFEDAKAKACAEVCEVDFGKLECIDWHAVNAEDENGVCQDY